MNGSLALAGLALGVASSPHCALMCGSPCAMVTSRCRSDALGFHLGRIAGYAAGGAIAAASIAALGTWSRTVPALQPLWVLLHLAFLGLGLWWVFAARMPRRMVRDGAVTIQVVGRGGRPIRAGLLGLGWVAWPCGALQAALLLSALAGGAVGGALVMACFAIASMPALAAAPWLWNRWRLVSGRAATPAQVSSWGYRIAGLGLVATSGWALGMSLSERIAAFCST